MRFFITLSLVTGYLATASAQNAGVGTSTPITKLHVSSNNGNVLTVENSSSLNTGVISGLDFAAGINTPNSYKYTGAIRTIGIGTTEARLGLFTFASNSPNSLIERLSITDNGNVGINITNPLYRLSVNGSSYFSTYVGIQTPPDPSYSLLVDGSARYYSNLRIDGILNPNNTLNIGNNANVEGSLTVAAGKGIVRSTSSTQMKLKRSTVGFSASNLGAGVTILSGYLNFGEDFSAVTVAMGQAFNSSGDWAKILVVPFEVDEINDRCRFAITNVSGSLIDFTVSYEVLLVGN